MQKRFWLKTFDTVQSAYEEKTNLLKEDDTRVLQVRRGRDGGRIVFRLVERFSTAEAKVIDERRNSTKRKRRRPARAI